MSELIITIPHYNNPTGLLQTIESIDEEFLIDIIIVDDGSNKKPNEKLIRSKHKKGNINFKYLIQNQGVGIAANECLSFVKKGSYKYVARLDAGDICYKDKFKKQINFLDSNPEIKLVGTWARVVDTNNTKIVIKFNFRNEIEFFFIYFLLDVYNNVTFDYLLICGIN